MGCRDKIDYQVEVEMKTKVYVLLSRMITAHKNCIENGNNEWKDKHLKAIQKLVYECMPSGCGVDNGTKIDMKLSTGEKFVFKTSYHHMNETGYYMNWSHHVVTVLPSLQNDITLRISGRNVNEIKDHLWCVFEDSLKAEVDGKFAYED